MKTRHPRSLPPRLILIVAGALMLIAAFAPRANAQQLIAYFNFEGPPTPPYPVNMMSDVPPGFVSTTLITNYTTADISAGPGIPLNVAPGDMDPNLTSLGLRRSGLNNGRDFDIQLFSAQGFFQNMTLSFATNGNGNGFTAGQLSYSTNGGPFTAGPSALLTQQPQIVSLAVPVGANNAPLLVLRFEFSGGQSNGNDLQTIVDNIQINGTIVPEPATIAGGLLGVLGLCWFQRRRLIFCVRLRRS